MMALNIVKSKRAGKFESYMCEKITDEGRNKLFEYCRKDKTFNVDPEQKVIFDDFMLVMENFEVVVTKFHKNMLRYNIFN